MPLPLRWCRGDRLLFEGSDELVRACNPAEQRLDGQQGCVVITSWEIVADGLAQTIRQYDTQIVPEHRVSDRRFHADARGAARDDEVFHAQLLQGGIQVRVVEAA